MPISNLLKPNERIQTEFAHSAKLEKAFASINISHLRAMLKRLCQRQLSIVNSDIPIALGSAMLGTARAEAFATQDRTTLLGLERNGVRLAALIANNLEPLAFAAATAA